MESKELFSQINVVQNEGRLVYRLSIAEGQLNELIISMVLLRYDLISMLSIISGDAVIEVSIIADQQNTTNETSMALISDDKVHLKMAEVEFDYWLRFYLDQYRDGKNILDHIDVQFYDFALQSNHAKISGVREFYLVLN